MLASASLACWAAWTRPSPDPPWPLWGWLTQDIGDESGGQGTIPQSLPNLRLRRGLQAQNAAGDQSVSPGS